MIPYVQNLILNPFTTAVYAYGPIHEHAHKTYKPAPFNQTTTHTDTRIGRMAPILTNKHASVDTDCTGCFMLVFIIAYKALIATTAKLEMDRPRRGCLQPHRK